MSDTYDLAELLLRVSAGDRIAFRQLYNAQGARLYGVALRITRQAPLASDAVHDAFLQVWQRAGSFDPDRGNPEAWLISLVRYRALDIARKRVREVPDDSIPEQIDGSPDALQLLQEGGEASALRACLEELGTDRQHLIVLAFIEGLSHTEVAERVRMPLGTVKSAIRRGLMALRACLDGSAPGLRETRP